jgi:hypothetical protein
MNWYSNVLPSGETTEIVSFVQARLIVRPTPLARPDERVTLVSRRFV